MFLEGCLKHNKVVNSAIFNTLRILKKKNPGDTYLENYQAHYEKRGDTFVDVYHLLWYIGAVIQPRRIMEIGCRTGISIAQLLSAAHYFPEKVVLFDLFGDGFISPELVKIGLNYLSINTDNIEFIVGDSLVTVPQYKESNFGQRFDYILVDGCHEKNVALADLINVVPLVDTGGIILFDDIGEDGCNDPCRVGPSHDAGSCRNTGLRCG